MLDDFVSVVKATLHLSASSGLKCWVQREISMEVYYRMSV